ncbi:MAG: DnaJ domain-containing protein [Chloroflexi bacterium]|nr:DnaJ domain-containing protein [Chloroflexota bacterium]
MGASIRDPYQVLGVSPGASTEVIESAYRRLCLRFHPDVNSHPEAERRMKEINAAYELLVRRRRATRDDPPVDPLSRSQTYRPRAARGGTARPGAPALFVPQTQLDLGEVALGETPLGRVDVRNVGGGLLHGVVSASEGWLRFTPATFDANRLTVQVFASVSMLAPGEVHRATLTIRTNGGTAQVEIQARVRRPAGPEAVLQPAHLLLGNLPHGLVTAATVELRNGGAGTLHGTAAAHQPWLRVEPARFVGNLLTLTVAVDLRPLTPGLDHYSAVELCTNAGTVRLPVQVYVAPRRGLPAHAAVQWRAVVASGQLLLRRLISLVR